MLNVIDEVGVTRKLCWFWKDFVLVGWMAEALAQVGCVARE